MSKNENFMLEDEDDGQDLLSTHVGSSMVASATTDTLDSVALEPSPLDDDQKDTILADAGVLGECIDLGSTSQSKPGPLGMEGGDFNVTTAVKVEPATDRAKPDPSAVETSISSYFASSEGGDIFDSLTGAVDENLLTSNDLFMSMTISKSEEDIRESEMNAREITEQDVLSPAEIDSSSSMPRISSFLRKQEEEEHSDSSQIMNEVERALEEKTEVAVEGIQAKIGGDEESSDDGETVEEEVTLIRHSREHKTSSCEPESIAFEGEGETETVEPPELQEISNLAEKEEFEDFTAQVDEAKPSFMSQISHLSDRSDASMPNPAVPGTPPVPSTPQQMPGILRPPSNSGGMVQGPVLGSTPSQMSPMGTPIHQGTDNKDLLTSSPAKPVNPLDAQNSMPGSPFQQTSQEAKTGSVFAQFGSSGGTDDAFTSILSMSDSDRRHDAWIPSDATNHILKTLATGQAGSTLPTAEQLSTPGVIYNEPQGDPVRDLVLRYMGEQEAVKRSVLTVDSVTQDVDGLKKLIESGCLRAAIDLTARLLDQVGQGYGKAGYVTMHTPHSLQLWFVRLTLMVKLRMYEQAETEMRAFQTLDTPDMYFQYYANIYPGRRGSMASVSMRMLHAELPLLCGRSQETLDRLYYMLAVCNRIKTNLSSDLSEDGSATHMTYEARKVSLELWNKREIDIIYKIGSAMLAEKDYEGALVIYNNLMEKDTNVKLELKAGIGRIHLQMGNISEATRIIKEVEADYAKSESPASCFNLVSKGLVAMCANNFQEGYQSFKSAVQMQPHNTCAVNNMAVCSLYLGRLKDALNTLEQLVHSDPANTLHEGVLFNLCTLYELETSRALHKKQAILDLVSKHKGDGFPVACLKMT